MLTRREEVAKWLQKYMVAKEHGKSPPSGPAKILHLLLIGDLEAAVQEAVKSNYPHLACGLSVFRHTSRDAYKNQVHICLRLWEKSFFILFCAALFVVSSRLNLAFYHKCAKKRNKFFTFQYNSIGSCAV